MRESEPRFDMSPPTGLRVRAFLFSVLGALLMGVGAVANWVTVGIPIETAHTSLRGVDLTEGRIVLFLSLIVLVVVVGSRVVPSRRVRQLLAALELAAGLATVAIAAAFLVDGRDHQAVIRALGIPREMWAQLGAFRDLGPGPYVALVGGVSCALGGVLTLLWARRLSGNDPLVTEVSAEVASG